MSLWPPFPSHTCAHTHSHTHTHTQISVLKYSPSTACYFVLPHICLCHLLCSFSVHYVEEYPLYWVGFLWLSHPPYSQIWKPRLNISRHFYQLSLLAYFGISFFACFNLRTCSFSIHYISYRFQLNFSFWSLSCYSFILSFFNYLNHKIQFC